MFSEVQTFAQSMQKAEQCMDALVTKVEANHAMVEKQGLSIMVLKLYQKERAMRIRAYPEQNGEVLLTDVANLLALQLNIPEDQLCEKMEKIFRINSSVAKEKNLPRDVVVFLDSRVTRDLILQAHYKTKYQHGGKDLILMKELAQ